MSRLALRGLDRTGWVRLDGPGEEELLQSAVAEVRPAQAVEVGPDELSRRELPFASGTVDVVACSVLGDLQEADGALAEFARVLRSGGRFVGIYDTPDHLRELLGEVPESFDSESGLPLLQAHFVGVSRRYCRGSVLWLTQRDLQSALDSYVDGSIRAPDGPYPFTATREKCVFVADAP